VREKLPGQRTIKAAAGMHCPERVQRARVPGIVDQARELRDERRIAPISQKAQGGLSMPFVGLAQEIDKMVTRARGQIEFAHSWTIALRPNPVNAAVGTIPGIAGIHVTQACVGPIGEVNRPVRTCLDIHRPEPFVGRPKKFSPIPRGVTRTRRPQFTEHDLMVQRDDGDQLTVILMTQRAAFVDDKGMTETRSGRFMRHGREVAEGVRVGEESMLAKILRVIAALHKMEPAMAGAVEARPRPPGGIEFEPKRVAAAFRE
jgi:hypothetical protein